MNNILEIVSFVGVSYSGKSTLAEGVAEELLSEGVTADIIKKDEAIKAYGRKHYGDNVDGYSISGAIKHGELPTSGAHEWMNDRIRSSRELGHVALLEGGTRTRRAQTETLSGINFNDDNFRIFMLQLPFKEVLSRAKERRKYSGRYDDSLLLAGGKLLSQYIKNKSADAVSPDDSDVIVLNASLPPQELVQGVLSFR